LLITGTYLQVPIYSTLHENSFSLTWCLAGVTTTIGAALQVAQAVCVT